MTLRQEQWLKLGRLYESPRRKLLGKVFFYRGGICWGMSKIAGHKRHYYHLCELLGAEYCRVPQTQENDSLRALFCYLMAVMTDEERDDIVKGL